MAGESNDIKFDKLEFLFNQQKALVSQNYSELEKGNNGKQPKTEVAEAPPPPPTAAENKMKRLYDAKEPFSGYRIFMLSSALLHEVVELQRETDWKWWKTEKGLDNHRIQEEVIDLWHFLIQLSIEAGLDPELLVSKYIEKNKENTKRQQQGY